MFERLGPSLKGVGSSAWRPGYRPPCPRYPRTQHQLNHRPDSRYTSQTFTCNFGFIKMNLHLDAKIDKLGNLWCPGGARVTRRIYITRAACRLAPWAGDGWGGRQRRARGRGRAGACGTRAARGALGAPPQGDAEQGPQNAACLGTTGARRMEGPRIQLGGGAQASGCPSPSLIAVQRSARGSEANMTSCMGIA